MQIYGELRDGRPLIVVAVQEEAVAFPAGVAYITTGAGKVNAAVSLSYVLARVRPSIIINIGTAGALRPHLEGMHEIASVSQHDLDVAALEAITGRPMRSRIELAAAGRHLVTGDVFVSSAQVRDRLAEHADLVDMEGFSIAATAHRFEVPVRLVKYVSDTADESAMTDWPSQTRIASERLAEWLDSEL